MTGNMTDPHATSTLAGGQSSRSDFRPASTRENARIGNDLRTRAITATALLLVGTAAFGAAACGGSTSAAPTATTAANDQAFIAQVNGACDQDNLRQGIGSPPKINPSNPTAEDLAAAAAYFDKKLTVVQAVLSDLEHLGEPPQNRQTIDGAITALRQAAGDAQSADKAAKQVTPTPSRPG